MIIFDCREGEPDRTASKAILEGFFDPESGDPRRPGQGIPRLHVGNERVWGFECWWRLDPSGEGLTPRDHEELEASKRLLRGLLRDVRRSGRLRELRPRLGVEARTDPPPAEVGGPS